MLRVKQTAEIIEKYEKGIYEEFFPNFSQGTAAFVLKQRQDNYGIKSNTREARY